MIDVNELRIGNKICPYVRNEGEVATILIIDGNVDRKFDTLYLECKESFEWTEFDRVSGITITEQILLNCGFKNNNDREYFYIEIGSSSFAICINPKFTGICLFDDDDIQIGRFYINIEYVHQLQNLYFSLSGKELEINL